MEDLRGSAWYDLQMEYKSAKLQLSSLLREGNEAISRGAADLLKQLDEQYNKLSHRVEEAVPYSMAMTAPLPPPINRKKLKGMLAYRAWKMVVKGQLSPSFQVGDGKAWTSEVSFADYSPLEDSSTFFQPGLHATKLSAWETNRYSGTGLSGLVDCYGDVVEHNDGVIRAECARILMLFCEVDHDHQVLPLILGTYEALRYRYPNTPVYMVTSWQKKLIIWREVIIDTGMMDWR